MNTRSQPQVGAGTERYRALREDDREMDPPDSWKMTALRMMLFGEIQNSVEYRKKEFKTYEKLRAVVMKGSTNGKIDNGRSLHDPMDCDHTQGADHIDPNWSSQGNWSEGTQEGTPEGFPHDINYMYSKGERTGAADTKG